MCRGSEDLEFEVSEYDENPGDVRRCSTPDRCMRCFGSWLLSSCGFGGQHGSTFSKQVECEIWWRDGSWHPAQKAVRGRTRLAPGSGRQGRKRAQENHHVALSLPRTRDCDVATSLMCGQLTWQRHSHELETAGFVGEDRAQPCSRPFRFGNAYVSNSTWCSLISLYASQESAALFWYVWFLVKLICSSHVRCLGGVCLGTKVSSSQLKRRA